MTIKKGVELEVTSCCVCNVDFAVPETIMNNRRQHAGHIWCPNGHQIGWSESESDRLKKRLQDMSQERDWFEKRSDEYRQEAEHERKRVQGYKGQLTKVKNRVGNGVCPCCNRYFENLHRHMDSKHPGYKSEGVSETPPVGSTLPHKGPLPQSGTQEGSA